MAKHYLIFILLFPLIGLSQNREKPLRPHAHQHRPHSSPMSPPLILAQTTIFLGDTIPYFKLTPVACYASRYFKTDHEHHRWTRLKYNVKKVYPYAILAAAKLSEYDNTLRTMTNERAKKRYTKRVEKELKEQFGPELKNLTRTQGRILLKLIDRETGKTTYAIVKEMRGSFSAFMWQTLSLMFSSNMKDGYNAEEEDQGIERAIKLIENGDF